VKTILKAFLAALAGLALGVWATAELLADGGPFDMVSLGPWNVATRAGAIDADPYTRAALERSGEIPIALGEGLQMIARVDDAGRPLDRNCVYRVGPHVPAARYWTLGVVDLKGFPIDNPAERRVLRSSEILRESDGGFAIYVSGSAHSGNWLPVGRARRFALVLRLYDSPLSATAGGIEKAAAPQIVRESCA
jgi:hypothetical protein